MPARRFRPQPRSPWAALLVAFVVARGVAATAGEHPQLARAYGDGVHAYFAADYQRSYEELSQAIEGGTLDPRAWYFRGLAALKLGRTDEAEADFSTAARREADGTGAWPVSRSLERVQGCDRLKIERHRARAGIARLQEDRLLRDRRYRDTERARDDVTRRLFPIDDERIDDATRFEREAVGNLPPPDGAAAEPMPVEGAEPAVPEPAAEPAAVEPPATP